MSDDLILQLALQAMHDEDVLPVMLDAIEETGWDATPAKWLWEDNRALIWVELTVSSWPRAVAAVLLFAGWPTSWPLAERCRVTWVTEGWHVRVEDPRPNVRVTAIDRSAGIITVGATRVVESDRPATPLALRANLKRWER